MLQTWQYYKEKLLSNFDDQSALIAHWMMCGYSTVYQICFSSGAGNTVLKMAVLKTIRQLVYTSRLSVTADKQEFCHLAMGKAQSRPLKSSIFEKIRMKINLYF